MDINETSLRNEIPNFQTHEQARQWFKEQFDERFSLKEVVENEGRKDFYYHLIKDPEAYQNYMESFGKIKKHDITNPETFESYSTIIINQDGDIQFLQ